MIYEKEIQKIVHSKKKILGIKENIKNINVSSLGVGENNRSILAIVNKKYKFVFRITLHEVKDIKKEWRRISNLKMIPEGLGPKPILFDDSKKFIPEVYSILSYVEGKSANKWTNKQLALHAKALAAIHKKKFTYWCTTEKRKKVFDLNKKFTGDIKGFKDILNDSDINLLLPKIKKYVNENNHLFTELNHFSLIHGDTCNNNILFNKGKIRYVDWEWISVRDNAEDIARVYSKDYALSPWFIKLSERQIDYLVNTYLKYNQDKTLKERVEVWNNVLLFTDLMYFKWKLKHFKTEISVLPKKHYENAVKIMAESFRKKFS